jgi:NADP-dependent 3-hydroxy acid dehydrogenase YdfG
MSQLSNKVALITGASSGIGEATARRLAEQGATVILVARRKDRLDKLVKEIKKAGGKAEAIEADLQKDSVAPKLIERVIKDYGRIDILVNNAGVMLLGPVINAPLEEWENMISLNVLSLMRLTHAALPHMQKAKSGHIINISSVAGRIATANSAVYNASKWAVNAFTEALRQEVVTDKLNIRTTLIEPGAVATELVSHNRKDIRPVIEKRLSGITKKLEADDIARAITYAVTQPEHVNVNEILIRPTSQPM